MDSMYPEPRRKNRGFLGWDSSALNPQDRQDQETLRYRLDLNNWNFRIFLVAASGFLTDSYNLFATNVILASISFVYFPNDRWPGLVINLLTLTGSVIGQLLFGFLADFYGRTRLYGIELILVIVSTIGVATSSFGHGDLSFLALFTWWRFVMGIGIGGEYPLSAVITSEWSSTTSRVKMLASVFAMQPVGQCLAQLVGLWVVLGRRGELDALHCGLDKLHDEDCRRLVDGVWRIVIGIGAAPALLAIIFRFFLYDCGLYTLEVKNKPGAAFRNTEAVYGPPPTSNGHRPGLGPGPGPGPGGNGAAIPSHSAYHNHLVIEQETPVQFSLQDLRNFLVRDGNWRYLLGTSMAWFFLDVSFYGFSLDNRGTLSDLWATSRPVPIDSSLPCWNSQLEGGRSAVQDWTKGNLPTWQTDALLPCNTISDVLIEQAQQYILTVSIASIAGSVCFIFSGSRFHRRRFLTASFFALALLFLVTGGVYYGVNHRPGAPATVAMVAICHFAFNFGANTLTFIIPAEIFPTAYRATCHGISAAAGKVGSLIAVLIVYGINQGYKDSQRQGLIFLLFSTWMVLGALFSWAYLPDVQRRDEQTGGKLEPMTLEDLGGGREKARREGQVITIREKLAEIKLRSRRNRGTPGSYGP